MVGKKAKKLALILIWALTVPSFLWSQGGFWGISVFAADESSANDGKSEEIDDTKDSIEDLQEKLEKEQKALEQKQAALGQLKGAVSATQSAINKTKTNIQETAEDIERKEAEIENLNDQMTLQKVMLKELLQELYYIRTRPVLNEAITETNFGKVFSYGDQILNLQDKILAISKQIGENKSKIEEDKVELAETKEKHEEILDQKVEQKQGLLEDQAEVQLTIEDKQKVIDRLNKELSELQSDLSALTGKSYSAKDIKEAVEFASDKTGVPKGFLVGVLKMETNLGKNVGGCTYSQVESGAEKSYKAGKLGKRAWATFQNRREIFKDICGELDLDYKKQKVSCNPSGYTGTGGAMGVAQFMPDTWNGYKSQVASMTGHNPPSPWELTDGVMAMALKLKKTPGVTAGKESAFKTAACSYLGTCYAPYINGILYWAKHYKELL